MQAMASDLTAEEMRLLGMYFESKATRTHAVADPELAQVGRFVYNRGNPSPASPPVPTATAPPATAPTACRALGGQHAQYVENQLRAFSKRERTNDNAVMHTIASKLSELELKAVASYISGLHAPRSAFGAPQGRRQPGEAGFRGDCFAPAARPYGRLSAQMLSAHESA